VPLLKGRSAGLRGRVSSLQDPTGPAVARTPHRAPTRRRSRQVGASSLASVDAGPPLPPASGDRERGWTNGSGGVLPSRTHVTHAKSAPHGGGSGGVGAARLVPLPSGRVVVTGPTVARPCRGRVSDHPADPVRGRSHRDPGATVRAARRAAARKEPFADGLGPVGRRMVPVDRRARLLVRSAGPVQCRVLPPVSPADQGCDPRPGQPGRGRTPRRKRGGAWSGPRPLALGASRGGAR
jgi:hypothetical protein